MAYVTPRYGLEVVGGAELGARLLAEHLVSECDVEVEVFTTCALEASTWEDHFAPETTSINGVTVHRYSSESGRDPNFDEWGTEILRFPERASVEQSSEWIKRQGPYCPAVVDAAVESSADLIGYYPYLYYPTVAGVQRDPKRAVLHAAAHNEQPIRLPVFSSVFESAAGIWYQSPAEQQFASSLFKTSHVPQSVVGLGVEKGEGDVAAARREVGLGDEPFVICVGRVDSGKGTTALAEFFAAYKARNPGPLKLVIAGPVLDQPLDHPDVFVAGRISEEAKWGLLSDAKFLISPSAFEAFSIVLMEAWLMGIPVLVNQRGAVTTEHARVSGGGLSYDGFAHFEVAIQRLMADSEMRSVMGAKGQAYVEQRFCWPNLIQRYRVFLELVLSSPYPS